MNINNTNENVSIRLLSPNYGGFDYEIFDSGLKVGTFFIKLLLIDEGFMDIRIKEDYLDDYTSDVCIIFEKHLLQNEMKSILITTNEEPIRIKVKKIDKAIYIWKVGEIVSKNRKQSIILDFDGVIHSYKSGWKGATIIPDMPVNGIHLFVEKLREKYNVIVVSTRCYSKGGIEAIKAYLKKYNIEVDCVTGTKPPAILTIDDRAVCFKGNFDDTLEEIDNFVVWTKKGD